MISIALASYNGSKYIREQLDSILSQTYQNFELIICDDCSTDNTWQILEEYAQKNSRIKIFKNEKNLGFKKNFEKAISLCSGEYIATSDQDDIWTNNHLTVLLETIKDGMASAGEALLVNAEGYSMNRYMTKDVSGYEIDVPTTRKLSHLLFCTNPFSGAVCLFKKEVFEIALPIPNGIDFQDTWFTACALCMGDLYFNNTVITKHRLHENNESGNQDKSFLARLKRTLYRKFSTDRILLGLELLKIFPSISDEKKEAIKFATKWLQARKDFKKKDAILLLIKNHKKMFASNNKWQLLLRCFQIIVRN